MRRAILIAVAISLVFGSSIIGLAFAEGMIRVFFPAYDPSGQIEFIAGSNGLTLGPANQEMRQTKNTGDYDVAIRFNEHGFRDAKNIATMQSDDIVVVGDSFAFGWGVEEDARFSNVLQGLLQRRVFNIAIGGAYFETYDKLLRYGESLGARMENVVIAVCMENDLFAVGAAGQASGAPNRVKPTPSQTTRLELTLRGTKAWLTRNSAVYRMSTAVVQQTPWLKKLAVRANLLVPNLAGIVEHTYSRKKIERSAARLAEIASRYKHVAILIIPSRALWVGRDRSDEHRLHREFIGALAARGLIVTDLRRTFEAGGDPLSYHFRNDGHWKPKGHRVAAEALAPVFTEHQW